MDKGGLVRTWKADAIAALVESMQRYPRLFGVVLGVTLQPILSALVCTIR
jgi:hypothetical protein